MEEYHPNCESSRDYDLDEDYDDYDREPTEEYDDYDYDTPEYRRFRENMDRIPWVSDIEKGWCRGTVLKLAEGDPMMSLELCKSYLCSDRFAPDAVEAARWGIKAAEAGSECVGVLLDFLLRKPGTRVDPFYDTPFRYRGQEHYRATYFYTATSFQTLMMVTDSRYDMSTRLYGWSNESDGFENDIFLFRKSINWDFCHDEDGEEERELPTFVFKPTGLRLWYDENPADTHSSNQPVNFRILDEVFVQCIEGSKECFQRGTMQRCDTPINIKTAHLWDWRLFPNRDTVQWLNENPWPGHGAEVYAMEDEIREALELTGFEPGTWCVNTY